MRSVVAFTAVALLAACQPPVPDSRVGGVGFDNYSDYLARREAALSRPAPAPGPIVAPPVSVAANNQIGTLPASSTGAPNSSDLARAGISSGSAAELPQQPAPPVIASAAPLPAVGPVNPGISDEQDFGAVSQRESIESDKQRIAQNRAQYQQIAPTDLPARTAASDGAVDLVEYAIQAPNRLGEAIYPRSKLLLSNWQKNCARYATPEAAQQTFLKAGGPTRDRKNLDPDGDGFACYWDPTPFQKVRG